MSKLRGVRECTAANLGKLGREVPYDKDAERIGAKRLLQRLERDGAWERLVGLGSAVHAAEAINPCTHRS